MALLAGPNVTVYNLYKQQISPLEAGKSQGKHPKFTSWIVYYTHHVTGKTLTGFKIAYTPFL